MLTWKPKTVSLQRRLLSNLLAVVLPLGLMVTITAVLATRLVTEDMARSLTKQSIKQTSDELDLYFASVNRLLATTKDWVQSGLLGVDRVDALRTLMQPLLANEPQVSSFLLADELGHELMLLQTEQGWRLRQTSPERPGQVRWLSWQGDADAPVTAHTELSDYDPRQRPWFSGALSAKRTDGLPPVYWTEPYRLLTTGDPGITASVATPDRVGQRRIVALDVLLLDIARFTRGLALSEGGGVIVLDEKAQPLTPSTQRQLNQPQPMLSDQSIANAQWDQRAPPLTEAKTVFEAATGGDLQLVRFSRQGEPWWGARQPFQLSGERSLRIQVLIPEAELLDELAALPWAVVLFLLAVIAAASWRMHAVSHRFSEPITQLVAATERLRQGDFSPSPSLGTNISELRRLQKAQNRMRIGLQSLMRLERDLQLARDIQRAALPKALPTLPGFDLDLWTEPADETGGDTYDVIPRTQDQCAVLMLADATGHGIGPALTATEVRALLRMAVRAGLALDEIAAQLNDQLHDDLEQGRFVTAWLAEVDCPGRRVRTLSAGQAPILVLRAASGRCEILPADAPPLGVLLGMAPSAGAWSKMAPGDIIAVISDGIFEASNAEGAQFGIERTVSVITAQRAHTASHIRRRLLQQLNEFTKGRAADDDRTILILKAG